MTGEARTASVIAATPLVCYRADKPAEIVADDLDELALVVNRLGEQERHLAFSRERQDCGLSDWCFNRPSLGGVD